MASDYETRRAAAHALGCNYRYGRAQRNSDGRVGYFTPFGFEEVEPSELAERDRPWPEPERSFPFAVRPVLELVK